MFISPCAALISVCRLVILVSAAVILAFNPVFSVLSSFSKAVILPFAVSILSPNASSAAVALATSLAILPNAVSSVAVLAFVPTNASKASKSAAVALVFITWSCAASFSCNSFILPNTVVEAKVSLAVPITSVIFLSSSWANFLAAANLSVSAFTKAATLVS